MNNITSSLDQLHIVTNELAIKLGSRSAHVGVIGLGYVGLPLAVAASRARLCVDTRNAFAKAGIRSPHIVKA